MKSLVLSAAKSAPTSAPASATTRGPLGRAPRRGGRGSSVARSDDGRRLTVQVLRERWIVRGHRGDKATGGVTVKARAAPPCALRSQCAGTQRVGPLCAQEHIELPAVAALELQACGSDEEQQALRRERGCPGLSRPRSWRSSARASPSRRPRPRRRQPTSASNARSRRCPRGLRRLTAAPRSPCSRRGAKSGASVSEDARALRAHDRGPVRRLGAPGVPRSGRPGATAAALPRHLRRARQRGVSAGARRATGRAMTRSSSSTGSFPASGCWRGASWTRSATCATRPSIRHRSRRSRRARSPPRSVSRRPSLPRSPRSTQRLICERLLPASARRRAAWRLQEALETYPAQAHDRLTRPPRPRDPARARRGQPRAGLPDPPALLRARVIDATGLIEDGTALAARGIILSRRVDGDAFYANDEHDALEGGAPDLISPATEAAAPALGWTDPRAAAEFFRERGPEATRRLEVALRLPPAPAYHCGAHGPQASRSIAATCGTSFPRDAGASRTDRPSRCTRAPPAARRSRSCAGRPPSAAGRRSRDPGEGSVSATRTPTWASACGATSSCLRRGCRRPRPRHAPWCSGRTGPRSGCPKRISSIQATRRRTAS